LYCRVKFDIIYCLTGAIKVLSVTRTKDGEKMRLLSIILFLALLAATFSTVKADVTDCWYRPTGDLNADCIVGLEDFAVLGANWLGGAPLEPIVWDIATEGDILPSSESPAWIAVGTAGSVSLDVDPGNPSGTADWLHLLTGTETYVFTRYFVAPPEIYDADFDSGLTVAFRARCYDGMMHTGGVVFGDGTRGIEVRFLYNTATSHEHLRFEDGDGRKYYTVSNIDQWHKYWIRVTGNQYYFYIDGVLLHSGTVTSGEYNDKNEFHFGDEFPHSTEIMNMDYDYMYLKLDVAATPDQEGSITWDIPYDGDVLPTEDEPAWIEGGSDGVVSLGGDQITPADYFQIDTLYTSSYRYYVAPTSVYDADFTTGVTVNFHARCYDDTMHSGGVVFGDGTYGIEMRFLYQASSDHCDLRLEDADGRYYYRVNDLGNWHDYWIAAREDRYDFYMDGVLLHSGVPTQGEANDINQFHIGDTIAGTDNSKIDYNYVRIFLDGAYAANGGACGDMEHPVPSGDVNIDCQIDHTDLELMTTNWVDQDPLIPVPQLDFTKLTQNPLIAPGAEPGGYITRGLIHCCVRRKNNSSPYMCWYSADHSDSSKRRIYLATSNDGINFTKQGVAIDENASGWHAHMPSVLWDPNSGGAGLWKMWYTSEHPYGTFYATSPDGATWTKYGQVMAIDPNPYAFDSGTVRSPAVIYDDQDNIYKMWYYGTPPGGHWGPCGYAESPDGIAWTRIAQLTLNHFRLLTPDVLKIDDVYYMWHSGGDTSYISYSVSFDGIDWQDYPENPVILPTTSGWDQGYIQAPTVVYNTDEGKLYLYYNGNDDGSVQINKIGCAWTWFSP